MASLATLLSQKQPQFQTHQALVVLGMQNEFLSPEGKLPVSTESGFVDRVKELVPKFRELAGDIIWVRSDFQGERNVHDGGANGEVVMTDEEMKEPEPQNGHVESQAPTASLHAAKKNSKSKKKALDLVKKLGARKDSARVESGDGDDGRADDKPKAPPDEELFLSYTPKDGPPCCNPGSPAADFSDEIKDCMEASDVVVVTSHYSAFNQTSLLVTLRMKLITELYICGCITNLSVYATAADAARHGYTINIIEDGLGYRMQTRHEAAMKAMTIMMGAWTVESADIMWDLNHPADESPRPGEDVLNEALDKMTLNEKPMSSSSKGKGKAKAVPLDKKKMEELETALEKIAISRDRHKGKSLVSEASLLDSTDDNDNSKQFHRKVRQYASQPDLSKGYMKSRIRMRPRAADKTKAVDEPSSPVKERPTTSSGPTAADREKSPPKTTATKGTAKSPAKSQIPAVAGSSKQVSSSANGRPKDTAAPTAAPEKPTVTQKAPTVEPPPRHSSRKQSHSKPSPPLRSVRSNSRTESGPAVPPVPHIPSIPARHSSSASITSKNDQKSGQARQQPTPQPNNSKQKGMPPDLSTLPTLGPADRIGEGDTYIKYDLLPDSIEDPISGLPLSSNIFHALYHEVKWQKMYHAGGEVPRLVAIQGAVDPKDGSKPVYRHPADQSPPLLPFTTTVDIIREAAEKVVGHKLNHVLIQLYRQGEDYISEHSDKTLDIAHGSSIVNASFGARRTMRLRTKKGYSAKGSSSSANGKAVEPEDTARTTQRIPMPHNSIFVLGQTTNALWLHGIPQDKRPPTQKAPEELAYTGMRISLTFRSIATFLSADEGLIWGQGASGKEKSGAKRVVSGDEKETERLVRAFGRENHECGDEEKWKAWYGGGFDVLHFTKE